MEALEGLRGVLAVHVLIHHTNVLPPYNFFTAMAMTVFFVLSGFSCAQGYAKTQWTVTTTLTFYKRRLVRLVPLHLLAQFVVMCPSLIQVCTFKYLLKNWTL